MKIIDKRKKIRILCFFLGALIFLIMLIVINVFSHIESKSIINIIKYKTGKDNIKISGDVAFEIKILLLALLFILTALIFFAPRKYLWLSIIFFLIIIGMMIAFYVYQLLNLKHSLERYSINSAGKTLAKKFNDDKEKINTLFENIFVCNAAGLLLIWCLCYSIVHTYLQLYLINKREKKNKTNSEISEVK